MAHKHKQHRNVVGNALGDCRAVLLARRIAPISVHPVLNTKTGESIYKCARALAKRTGRSPYGIWYPATRLPHFGAKQCERVLRELAH